MAKKGPSSPKGSTKVQPLPNIPKAPRMTHK